MAPSAIDEVLLVGGSSRMPCVTRLLGEVFPGKTISRTVDPEEAVAQGAAIMAAFLAGDKSDLLKDLHVQNMTPLSIGVDVNGGAFSVCIPRNTTIPVRKERTMCTAENNQPGVTIQVRSRSAAHFIQNTGFGRSQIVRYVHFNRLPSSSNVLASFVSPVLLTFRSNWFIFGPPPLPLPPLTQSVLVL